MKVEKLFKLYDKYNEKFFSGKLPYVDIAIVPLTHAYGWTVVMGQEVDIVLIAKGMKGKEIKATLLHEMIHVWQIFTERKMTHGKVFKKKAKVICKAKGFKGKNF